MKFTMIMIFASHSRIWALPGTTAIGPAWADWKRLPALLSAGAAIELADGLCSPGVLEAASKSLCPALGPPARLPADMR